MLIIQRIITALIIIHHDFELIVVRLNLNSSVALAGEQHFQLILCVVYRLDQDVPKLLDRRQ